jgi:hypothetical protein
VTFLLAPLKAISVFTKEGFAKGLFARDVWTRVVCGEQRSARTALKAVLILATGPIVVESDVILGEELREGILTGLPLALVP